MASYRRTGRRGTGWFPIMMVFGLLLTILFANVHAAKALDTDSATDAAGGLGDTAGQSDGTGSLDNPVNGIGGDLFGNIGIGEIALGAAGVAVLGGIAYLFLGGTKFVNSENVLENDARREIFNYIKTNPGVHLRATASALSLSTTNVLWHLRKLEQANLLNSKKLEGYKVYYPVEGGIEMRRMGLAMAVLRNPNAKTVLEFISGSPSSHQREIARAMGVNHGTIRWHLRKLQAVGLVLEVKKEHTSNYYVSELGIQALGRLESTKAVPAGVATMQAAMPAAMEPSPQATSETRYEDAPPH
ncbi:MAG: winged helix-turn-helix transcriptional regulator [Euryarchaeota archaeon]|nr:winged helix-turn-helix transcriptional regulator [Euryarchaeota archaeon]